MVSNQHTNCILGTVGQLGYDIHGPIGREEIFLEQKVQDGNPTAQFRVREVSFSTFKEEHQKVFVAPERWQGFQGAYPLHPKEK
jgi:hypothetical protein